MTFAEFLTSNLWWIIPCLLVCFFLTAYVLPKKKHLKTGRYELQFICQDRKGIITQKREIRKDIMSVITPFRPVKAYVNCYNPDCACDFPNFIIESTGKNWSGKQFCIKGLANMNNLAMFKINDAHYKITDELLARAFTLPGFTIETRRDFARKGTVRIKRKS